MVGLETCQGRLLPDLIRAPATERIELVETVTETEILIEIDLAVPIDCPAPLMVGGRAGVLPEGIHAERPPRHLHRRTGHARGRPQARGLPRGLPRAARRGTCASELFPMWDQKLSVPSATAL